VSRLTVVAGVTAAVVAVAVLVVALTRSPRGDVKRHPAGATDRAALHVARTRLGPTIVNAQGRTLYLFVKDGVRRSVCYGGCARVWPPALASGPLRAGRGVEAAKLTTTIRRDHSRQLVYNGHPLYAMSGDSRPGDTVGEGFLGTWFAVSPAGNRIIERGAKAPPAGY
jgi:predicted lipoprotein with Yx(FWY)xxD motif